MSNRKELLKFIAAMVIFGTNGLLVANISLSSAEIVLMRTLLGSVFLLAVVLFTGKFDFSALRKDAFAATFGGAALGLNWVLLFEAYRQASVSLATLTYYCGPMFVLLLSPILFRERLTWNKIAALISVALGMICITGSVDLTTTGGGLLLAAGAAFFYAMLIICNKWVKHLSGLHCSLYEMVVSFFVILIYLVIIGHPLPVIPAREELIYVLIIGLVNTGMAYLLYFSSLQKLSGQTVSLLCYMDPLTALFVSAAFLGEVMLPLHWVGAVLILGGACLGEFVFKKKA